MMMSQPDHDCFFEAPLNLKLHYGNRVIEDQFYPFSTVGEFIRNCCVNFGIEPIYEGYRVTNVTVWKVSKSGELHTCLDDSPNKELRNFMIRDGSSIIFLDIEHVCKDIRTDIKAEPH